MKERFRKFCENHRLICKLVSLAVTIYCSFFLAECLLVCSTAIVSVLIHHFGVSCPLC